MDKKSSESAETAVTAVESAPLTIESLMTPHERATLALSEAEGVRPISSSLAAGMFQLFLEGYSCLEISKLNKPFKEGEILFLRKKFNWDSERDRYASDLNVQIREKLLKQKLESLEFLTNMLAVTHKSQKEKMLKYLQTGDEKDMPETWVSGPKGYKDVLEAIQKLTGEEKPKGGDGPAKSAEININVKTEPSQPTLTPELQAKLLKSLSKENG